TPKAAESSSVKTVSWWQQIFSLPTGRQKAFAFSMAMALLLLAVGVVWLFTQNQRLRQDLAQIQNAQSAQARQVQDAEKQLASERTRAQELTDELERARA